MENSMIRGNMEKLKIENQLIQLEKNLEFQKEPHLRAEAMLKSLSAYYADFEHKMSGWGDIDEAIELLTAITLLKHYIKNGSFTGYDLEPGNSVFIPIKNRLTAIVNITGKVIPIR